jgi:hypothetical protein
MAFSLNQFVVLGKLAVILLLGTLLNSGCAPANNTQASYDSAVNFKTYQTFTWHPAEVPAPKQGSGDNLYSVLLDQRIKEAIASEMVKNGITPDTEKPGLLVAYDIAVKQPRAQANATASETGFGYGYSYWFGYRFRYDGTGLQNFRSISKYKPGSLVIDLIDSNTNRVVWRGTFDAGIDPAILDTDQLNKVIAKVMSQFPPVPSTFR